MGPEKPVPHFDAPWTLDGQGVIVVYRFEKSWVEQNAWLRSDQQGKFKGGLGYVMLVNYHHSPIGPYNELLIIPGRFYPHRRQAISRIFVNTQASTENGRFNWGIPKETRPISWRTEHGKEKILVGRESAPIFSCDISSKGLSFPITTKLLPICLQQELDGATFRTNPVGSGWAKFSRITNIQVDPLQFPDISTLQPLACFKLCPFRLHFPKAECDEKRDTVCS